MRSHATEPGIKGLGRTCEIEDGGRHVATALSNARWQDVEVRHRFFKGEAILVANVTVVTWYLKTVDRGHCDPANTRHIGGKSTGSRSGA